MTVLSADKKGEKLDQGKQASDVGQMSKKQKRGKYNPNKLRRACELHQDQLVAYVEQFGNTKISTCDTYQK